MKLVTLFTESREQHIGVLIPNSQPSMILDLHRLNQTQGKLPLDATQDMVAFIKTGEEGLHWAKTCLDSAHQYSQDFKIQESEAILLAPVPRPTSCRDGYAFRQHVEAARKSRGVPMIPEFDEFPVFYFTNHLAITGPGDLFVHSRALERFDFELEVAIVTAKEGRNISASQADDYIYGYMIMNDWSARELQAQEMKLNLGPAKGKDFATGLGPYLVTKDELAPFLIKGPHGDRYNLEMKAFHNGKQVSQGNVKDMTWTFAQILERVSMGVTIHPGEVIGSGTVGTGCYLELNGSKITDNVWIKPGDTFELEITGLGRLENKIFEERTV